MSDSDLNQRELEPGWQVGPGCGRRKQNSGTRVDAHTLLPRSCEHVTFHGQRDCADVIKLRILTRVNPGFSSGSNVITRSQCHKMVAGRSESRQDWTMLHFRL